MTKITIKITTKVVKVPNENEWIVLVWKDGIRYPVGDYYTDDKIDAIATAKHMML